MEKLYAPWRSNYVIKPQSKKSKSKCLFCEKAQTKKDEEDYILARYPHCFIMMNLYPYNAGHLMIVPNKHTKDLKKLSSAERIELMHALSEAIDALNNTLKPDGINVGINLGKAAGAGLPGHLHIHVLPRWEGDTNFMPLLANTKQISTDLNKIYQELKKNFN
ncbi:TPA: HIT family hydrolase [Candidatus Dependentiae bacterium]|nr:MAG: Histidine triad (HIT) protein [candidate division TM6 bacterium GW2011_GWF2_36_131]KKQ03721.1 MAG: Histidine triad (HIT) protein [candidate division TM6 bacterium GW2011_GWE2_36_25]KKQ20043.1 MAG: Histidine triad (HIT) protein [candidate division TM6 bacterium GW2011_GWA2_36_9]HBR70488.1 HIT family hydrolase [Candidatus Dependentiae bacterium]HCU00796.1 HIT family hydrolase [Candidatus Dependentiae bacterium]